MGCAPSTLRVVMEQLDPLILETTEAWEREGIARGRIGPMVGPVDATCWQRMLVVCLGLVSGYVLLEEVADDRPYATWDERVQARLEPLQTRVLSLVSDRAQALIKLAETGLRCPSIADVLHLLHEPGKGYALVLGRQLQAARQALSRAQERVAHARLREPARRGSSRPGRRWRPAKPTCRAPLATGWRIVVPKLRISDTAGGCLKTR